LLPVVLVRASRPQVRESLDGFVIGSLGALCFSAAVSLTKLAPQLATGPVARERPRSVLHFWHGVRSGRRHVGNLSQYFGSVLLMTNSVTILPSRMRK